MTVTDNVGLDGVDTLFNIERLQFTDVTINSPVTTAGTTVPNVLNNQTLAQATTTLANAGFGVASASANSATVPSGIVMSQTPAAGTVATSGSTVGIVVSLGPVLVQVPNVVGSTLAGATTSLQGLGFEVTSTTVTNAAPAGQVVTQNPASGFNAASGIDRCADRLGGPGSRSAWSRRSGSKKRPAPRWTTPHRDRSTASWRRRGGADSRGHRQVRPRAVVRRRRFGQRA